ncbi:MAG: cation:proton antiporter [Oscillatoria sp. PMC 1051.18]|nr:cation:proton antiporter [Oscillatoria sp. PMC 1050.18]MEC5028309.1 cation:proton antiporter [Oscillatoria sp. PMC 1051.18]
MIITTQFAQVSSSLPVKDPVYIFCIILLAIWLAPAIAYRLRLPALVVLILFGMILGTNVLGVLERDVQLILLEKVGLLYIMLAAGMQMDLGNLQKVGMRSLIFGLLTFSVPLTIGVISGQLLGYTLLAAVLLGIIYSPHTLLSYPIMTNLGISQKEPVGIAVGSTVVTSILTLIGLSIVQAIASGNVGILLGIKLLIFLPLLTLFAFWIIPLLGRQILDPFATFLTPHFVFVLACLFVTASATLLLGVDSIVGAFIAGLALNPLIPLSSPLMKQIEFVGNSLFIPAFLISVGILSNPSILFSNRENLSIIVIVVIGAVIAKFIAAWLAGQLFKYHFDEIMIMFSLTVSRAALVLVIALFGKDAGLLNEGIFNAVIIYILVTCLAGPIAAEIFGKRIATKIELL